MLSKFRNYACALLCLSVLVSSCQDGAQGSQDRQRGLQWVTSSIEYAAACEQTFRLAWPVVKKRALAQTENWVVVFDVDETVLNNSQYEVEREEIGQGFTRETWSEWVRREEATPVAGAKWFVDSLRTLGARAHVAFLTNRRFENEAATVANLKKTGLFKDGDPVLTKKGDDDLKADRRDCLQSGTGRCEETGPLVLLALFGDNIRDFMTMRGKDNADAYLSDQLSGDLNWGSRYFMLPNPLYGSWQRDYQ